VIFCRLPAACKQIYFSFIQEIDIMMEKLLAELIGSMFLVILGDGVCATVSLTKSGFKGAPSTHILMGWGMAVMLPAFAFGAISGAHFNPAVTVAVAMRGGMSWGQVPGYIIAQMLGGFVGAVFMWIAFLDQFDGTDDPGTIKACFCTAPAVRNYPVNLIEEILITFSLVFIVLGFGNAGMGYGVNYVLVFFLLTSIGMSFGGITAYGLNPCRDLAPRIAHAILPIKGKGKSDWAYSWVPVVGSLIGAILGAWIFKIFPW